LSWKKSCSPAVKMKSVPQSTHCRTLSSNSMESTPLFVHSALQAHVRTARLFFSQKPFLSELKPGLGPTAAQNGPRLIPHATTAIAFAT
jgi:hypothetical protein